LIGCFFGSVGAGGWAGEPGGDLDLVYCGLISTMADRADSWTAVGRIQNKVLASVLTIQEVSHWEVDTAVEMLSYCLCHLNVVATAAIAATDRDGAGLDDTFTSVAADSSRAAAATEGLDNLGVRVGNNGGGGSSSSAPRARAADDIEVGAVVRSSNANADADADADASDHVASQSGRSLWRRASTKAHVVARLSGGMGGVGGFSHHHPTHTRRAMDRRELEGSVARALAVKGQVEQLLARMKVYAEMLRLHPEWQSWSTLDRLSRERPSEVNAQLVSSQEFGLVGDGSATATFPALLIDWLVGCCACSPCSKGLRILVAGYSALVVFAGGDPFRSVAPCIGPGTHTAATR
jgi:hypothetical protein